MFKNLLPKIVHCMRYCEEKWYRQTGDLYDGQLRQKYRHTLVVYNSYCSSTTTEVTRTRLNITLYVHSLSCYCKTLHLSRN